MHLIQKGHFHTTESYQLKDEASSAAVTSSNHYQSYGKHLKQIQEVVLCFSSGKKKESKNAGWNSHPEENKS